MTLKLGSFIHKLRQQQSDKGTKVYRALQYTLGSKAYIGDSIKHNSSISHPTPRSKINYYVI